MELIKTDLNFTAVFDRNVSFPRSVEWKKDFVQFIEIDRDFRLPEFFKIYWIFLILWKSIGFAEISEINRVFSGPIDIFELEFIVIDRIYKNIVFLESVGIYRTFADFFRINICIGFRDPFFYNQICFCLGMDRESNVILFYV